MDEKEKKQRRRTLVYNALKYGDNKIKIKYGDFPDSEEEFYQKLRWNPKQRRDVYFELRNNYKDIPDSEEEFYKKLGIDDEVSFLGRIGTMFERGQAAASGGADIFATDIGDLQAGETRKELLQKGYAERKALREQMARKGGDISIFDDPNRTDDRPIFGGEVTGEDYLLARLGRAGEFVAGQVAQTAGALVGNPTKTLPVVTAPMQLISEIYDAAVDETVEYLNKNKDLIELRGGRLFTPEEVIAEDKDNELGAISSRVGLPLGGLDLASDVATLGIGKVAKAVLRDAAFQKTLQSIATKIAKSAAGRIVGASAVESATEGLQSGVQQVATNVETARQVKQRGGTITPSATEGVAGAVGEGIVGGVLAGGGIRSGIELSASARNRLRIRNNPEIGDDESEVQSDESEVRDNEPKVQSDRSKVRNDEPKVEEVNDIKSRALKVKVFEPEVEEVNRSVESPFSKTTWIPTGRIESSEGRPMIESAERPMLSPPPDESTLPPPDEPMLPPPSGEPTLSPSPSAPTEQISDIERERIEAQVSKIPETDLEAVAQSLQSQIVEATDETAKIYIQAVLDAVNRRLAPKQTVAQTEIESSVTSTAQQTPTETVLAQSPVEPTQPTPTVTEPSVTSTSISETQPSVTQTPTETPLAQSSFTPTLTQPYEKGAEVRVGQSPQRFKVVGYPKPSQSEIDNNKIPVQVLNIETGKVETVLTKDLREIASKKPKQPTVNPTQTVASAQSEATTSSSVAQNVSTAQKAQSTAQSTEQSIAQPLPVGARVQLKDNSSQIFTIERYLRPSQSEIANNKVPIAVRDERTGKTQTIYQTDIKREVLDKVGGKVRGESDDKASPKFARTVEQTVARRRERVLSVMRNVFPQLSFNVLLPNEFLERTGIVADGAILGNEVFLNEETFREDTPIHEVGHLWARVAKEKYNLLYNRMEALAKQSPYLEEVKRIYPDLNEAGQLEEAIAFAIGDKGAKIISPTLRERFMGLLRQLFEKIRQAFKIPPSKKLFMDMTFDELVESVAKDLVQGDLETSNINAQINAEKTAQKSSSSFDEPPKVAFARARAAVAGGMSEEAFNELVKVTNIKSVKNSGLLSGLVKEFVKPVIIVLRDLSKREDIADALKLSPEQLQEYAEKGVKLGGKVFRIDFKKVKEWSGKKANEVLADAMVLAVDETNRLSGRTTELLNLFKNTRWRNAKTMDFLELSKKIELNEKGTGEDAKVLQAIRNLYNEFKKDILATGLMTQADFDKFGDYYYNHVFISPSRLEQSVSERENFTRVLAERIKESIIIKQGFSVTAGNMTIPVKLPMPLKVRVFNETEMKNLLSSIYPDRSAEIAQMTDAALRVMTAQEMVNEYIASRRTGVFPENGATMSFLQKVNPNKTKSDIAKEVRKQLDILNNIKTVGIDPSFQERGLNLPFYEYNPFLALQRYADGVGRELANVKAFGKPVTDATGETLAQLRFSGLVVLAEHLQNAGAGSEFLTHALRVQTGVDINEMQTVLNDLKRNVVDTVVYSALGSPLSTAANIVGGISTIFATGAPTSQIFKAFRLALFQTGALAMNNIFGRNVNLSANTPIGLALMSGENEQILREIRNKLNRGESLKQTIRYFTGYTGSGGTLRERTARTIKRPFIIARNLLREASNLVWFGGAENLVRGTIAECGRLQFNEALKIVNNPKAKSSSRQAAINLITKAMNIQLEVDAAGKYHVAGTIGTPKPVAERALLDAQIAAAQYYLKTQPQQSSKAPVYFPAAMNSPNPMTRMFYYFMSPVYSIWNVLSVRLKNLKTNTTSGSIDTKVYRAAQDFAKTYGKTPKMRQMLKDLFLQSYFGVSVTAWALASGATSMAVRETLKTIGRTFFNGEPPEDERGWFLLALDAITNGLGIGNVLALNIASDFLAILFPDEFEQTNRPTIERITQGIPIPASRAITEPLAGAYKGLEEAIDDDMVLLSPFYMASGAAKNLPPIKRFESEFGLKE